MAAPLTTISYRIQNIDYLTYLELTDWSTNLQLRTYRKDDASKQQWNFSDGGGGAFYIQNVQDPTKYIGFSSTTVSVFAKTSTNIWNVVFDKSSYYIYYPGSYISANTQNSPTIDYNQTGYSIQRWKLCPVPSTLPETLPTGYYRIRTFNGLHLLTMPSGSSVEDASVFVKTQTLGDAYQRWLIQHQTDGSSTILNTGPDTSTYLACREGHSAIGDKIVGLPTAFGWNIRQIGKGLAWSIDLPQSPTPLSLGFADYEARNEENISLEATDTTPSQIWFLESFTPLKNDTVHAKRQLVEGSYKLQSCHDNTIYLNVTASPYLISPGTLTNISLVLTYNAADSPEFTLVYSVASGNHFVAAYDGYLGFARDPTSWVILSENKDDPGFYICISDSGYPRKVISSRVISDPNANSVFAIDDMSEGEPMQMWQLIKA